MPTAAWRVHRGREDLEAPSGSGACDLQDLELRLACGTQGGQYNDITARRLGHPVELMEAYESIRAMLPVAEYSLPCAGVSAGSPCHGCNTSDRPAGFCRSSCPSSQSCVGVLSKPRVKSHWMRSCRESRQTYPKVQFCFVHRLPGYRYEVECDETFHVGGCTA